MAARCPEHIKEVLLVLFVLLLVRSILGQLRECFNFFFGSAPEEVALDVLVLHRVLGTRVSVPDKLPALLGEELCVVLLVVLVLTGIGGQNSAVDFSSVELRGILQVLVLEKTEVKCIVDGGRVAGTGLQAVVGKVPARLVEIGVQLLELGSLRRWRRLDNFAEVRAHLFQRVVQRRREQFDVPDVLAAFVFPDVDCEAHWKMRKPLGLSEQLEAVVVLESIVQNCVLRPLRVVLARVRAFGAGRCEKLGVFGQGRSGSLGGFRGELSETSNVVMIDVAISVIVEIVKILLSRMDIVGWAGGGRSNTSTSGTIASDLGGVDNGGRRRVLDDGSQGRASHGHGDGDVVGVHGWGR